MRIEILVAWVEIWNILTYTFRRLDLLTGFYTNQSIQHVGSFPSQYNTSGENIQH